MKKKKQQQKNTKLAKNKKQCNKFVANIKIKQLKVKITSSLHLLFKCYYTLSAHVQDPSVSRNQKYCRPTCWALKMFFEMVGYFPTDVFQGSAPYCALPTMSSGM